jgi:hypothetical protein
MADEEIDKGLYKFAEDMTDALIQGIIATQKVIRIPLTGIQIGWNRLDLISRHRVPYHLIEIRIWWTRDDAR